MRATAAWALDRVLESRAPAGDILKPLLDRFEPRDRALLHELVLGSLRWLRRLDQVIEAASGRPRRRIDAALWAPLRIGAYQLLFLEKVPAHASVNEAVELARRIRHASAAGFVNAVLRRVAERPRLEDWPVTESDPLRRLAIETSHPDFLVGRWWRRFGSERTKRLLQSNNLPKPVHLLAFCDRGGTSGLARALAEEGLRVERSELSPLGLVVREGDPVGSAAFRRGDCYIQDEAAQVAALIPAPRPGERILDVAAAPGGKSFTLIAWEPRVRAVLADLSVRRMAILRANRLRLRRDLPLIVSDARTPAVATEFDRVILDLPCSGTGTLRKHPELKWRISAKEIERLAELQLQLIEGAAPLTAPGGFLAIITCSLEAEENEDLVARFLGREGRFSPASLDDLVTASVTAGVEGPGRWRMLTGGEHDGFTVHLLERRVS